MTIDLKYDLKYTRIHCVRESPIPIHIVRMRIDPHDSFSDESLRELVLTACDAVEELTNRTIFWSEWELFHKRGDILLPMGPVREIKDVQIKTGRKWIPVDLKNPDEFEQSWQNNESRYIKLKGWQSDQQVKVIYCAGYKAGDYLQGNIPASIYNYILSLCEKYYHKEPNQEVLEMRNWLHQQGINIW